MQNETLQFPTAPAKTLSIAEIFAQMPLPSELQHMPDFFSPRDRLRRARKAIEALRVGDYETFLMEQLGLSCLKAFKKIAPMLSDFQYSHCLRIAWQLSRATYSDRYKWLRLFNSERLRLDILMMWENSASFASLPDQVKIWRACGHPFAAHGLSWTTTEKGILDLVNTACDTQWSFRNKSLPEIPTVVSGLVSKNKIIARFSGSFADEVVVDPQHVTVLSIEQVELPQAGFTKAGQWVG